MKYFALVLALSSFGVALAGCNSGSTPPPTLPSAASLPASCTAATVGSNYSCTIVASGGKTPFTWSVSGLPSGLTYTVSADTTSLTISGMPQAQVQGAAAEAHEVHRAATTSTSANVSVTLKDAKGRTSTLSFSITVTGTTSPLSVSTTSPLPGGTAGSAYSASVTATGGTTPYTWMITGLPTGLSATSGTPSASISGTTDNVGTFTVTAQVTDAASNTASATLSLTMAQAAALTITTTSPLPGGSVGTPYSETLAATGGVTPYTWSLASGSSLPDGITLSTAGALSGTTSATGTFSFTVEATDAETPAQTAKQALSLTISTAPTTLSITTTSPLPAATLGTSYTTTVTASGGTPPYTWTLASGSTLPSSLSLASGTPSATISGTPEETGTYQFTLDVEDSASNSASGKFLITISGSTTLNCPTTVNLTLCGTYLMGMRGFNSSGGTTAFGVSFVANNSGNVISGTKDANDSVAGYTTSTITGGSYVMDSSGDGRGLLTLIDSNANSTSFRFALQSATNAGPGQIEEFDSTGTLASGFIFGPATLPIPQFPANGIFGLGLEGVDSAGNRSGLLAMMQLGPSGCDGSSGSLNSMANEPVVSNVAGKVDATLTLTGSCTASDPNTGLGTAQLTIGGGTPFTNTSLNFAYLNIGGVEVELLETDAIGSNQPILGGAGDGVVPPSGGFNASSLGCPCIESAQGTTTGNASTGGLVSLIVRILTTPTTSTSSTGTLSGVLDENAAGTVTLEGTWPYTSYTVDSNGVGTIIGTGPTVHFVATGSGPGFTMNTLDESTEVLFGSFRAQNGTSIDYENASGDINPFVLGRDQGSLGITHLTDHVIGVITMSGATSGNLSGTGDVISTSGSFPGVPLTASYMSIDSTTGRGTGTANLTDASSSVSIVIYATREQQFKILDVQSSNPLLVGAKVQ